MAVVAPKTSMLRGTAKEPTSGRDRTRSTAPEARGEVRINILDEVAPGRVRCIERRRAHAGVLGWIDAPAVVGHKVLAILEKRASCWPAVLKIQRDSDAGHRE